VTIHNLINHYGGSTATASSAGNNAQDIGETVSRGQQLNGGFTSDTAAAGIKTSLTGNQPAYQFSGKATSYGGAALLGGLAYKTFSNWQHTYGKQAVKLERAVNRLVTDTGGFSHADIRSPEFQRRLIKSMIAAAQADGQIDAIESERICSAAANMDMSRDIEGTLFELSQQPITVEELVSGAETIDQKTAIYLASCLASNQDHPSEQAHLDRLAAALELPEGLTQQLQWWAQKACAEAA
jgi:uncharacterized membrane protein YebE (DUF533 family)